MTTQELKQYVDRVLGNSIRCLLPSYWWRRLFEMVLDALSVLEKELKNKAEKLTVSNLVSSVESQRDRITNVENSLNQVSSNVKQVKILYIDDNDDLTSEQKEINKETLNSMYSDIVIGSVHTIKYKEDYDIVVYVRSLFYTPVVLIDAMFDGSSVILYCSAPYLLNYPLGKVLKVDFNRNTGGINSYELVDNITVDTSLSTTSTNPVQNKVVTSALNNKVDKVSGKQLSTEDFTTTLKTKLESLSNYDDTQLESSINTLRNDFDKLVSGDTTTAIKTFNEVIAFLDGISDTQDLEGIIASIQQQIAGKQDTISDLDTIRSGAALGATALQEHQQLKTINGQSIIGSGDITIEGGGGGDTSNLATKEELAECEEVAAAALNELNDRVNELSENVSGTTVTKEEFTEAIDNINATIIENEEISAAALNDLNNKITDILTRLNNAGL